MGYSHWPPFFIKQNNGTVGGVNADIVKAALEPAGYSIEFVEVPWTRGLRNLLMGRLDMIPSASFTKARNRYAYFSDAYYQEQFVLYVSQEDAEQYRHQSLNQLLNSGFRLGVFKGTDYGSATMRLLASSEYQDQIIQQTHVTGNYRMLKSKRLDGFIQEYSEYLYHLDNRLNRNPARSRESTPTQIMPLLTLDTINQHILFSKQSLGPEVAEDFNRGLRQLISNGQYQKIFHRWKAQPWMLNTTSKNPALSVPSPTGPEP